MPEPRSAIEPIPACELPHRATAAPRPRREAAATPLARDPAAAATAGGPHAS